MPLDEDNKDHTRNYVYPEENYEATNGEIWLLFKPGHYDLLYNENNSVWFPQPQTLDSVCSFCTNTADLTKGKILANGNCFHRACCDCALEIQACKDCPLCDTPIIATEEDVLV